MVILKPLRYWYLVLWKQVIKSCELQVNLVLLGFSIHGNMVTAFMVISRLWERFDLSSFLMCVFLLAQFDVSRLAADEAGLKLLVRFIPQVWETGVG